MTALMLDAPEYLVELLTRMGFIVTTVKKKAISSKIAENAFEMRKIQLHLAYWETSQKTGFM